MNYLSDNHKEKLRILQGLDELEQLLHDSKIVGSFRRLQRLVKPAYLPLDATKVMKNPSY